MISDFPVVVGGLASLTVVSVLAVLVLIQRTQKGAFKPGDIAKFLFSLLVVGIMAIFIVWVFLTAGDFPK